MCTPPRYTGFQSNSICCIFFFFFALFIPFSQHIINLFEIWKNFKKLKTNLDQQQKIEERQQKLVMELHKQQLEFQQFTLQKIWTTAKTLWRITRKFIKWLKKTLKKTRYFPRIQSITQLKHSNTCTRERQNIQGFSTGAMKIFSTKTVNNGQVKEKKKGRLL